MMLGSLGPEAVSAHSEQRVGSGSSCTYPDVCRGSLEPLHMRLELRPELKVDFCQRAVA